MRTPRTAVAGFPLAALRLPGRANLLRRLDQPVHQAAQIAAGDARKAGLVQRDAECFGGIQAELGIDMQPDLALGQRVVQLRFAEIDRPGRAHRNSREKQYRSASPQPHSSPSVKDCDR